MSHSLGLTIAYISKSGINLTFSLSGNFCSQVIERKSIMKKRSVGNWTGRNRCSIQVLRSLKWRRAILNTMDKTRWYWNENLMIFQFIELQGWNFLFDCKLLRESDLLASNKKLILMNILNFGLGKDLHNILENLELKAIFDGFQNQGMVSYKNVKKLRRVF